MGVAGRRRLVPQPGGLTFGFAVHLVDNAVVQQGTKVRRYNWHSAGSLGWPLPMLKYKYIFQIKYTEAVSSNNTPKLLWFEISKMLIAVQENKFSVSFIIIFATSVPYGLLNFTHFFTKTVAV